MGTRAHRSDSAGPDADAVQSWLDRLDRSLQLRSVEATEALFSPGAFYRDILAFTWHLTAREGARAIASLLIAEQERVGAKGLRVAPHRTPPRRVERAGIEVIEAIFQFETGVGRCYGVLRILQDDPHRALQLMTALNELKGFEERVGRNRPVGEAYSRSFGGRNWKEEREWAQRYADRDPAVLIVGAGQAGLGLAATLGRLEVDALVIDQNARVGDNWRHRYHSLALHNTTDVNHLPYMPFPPSWPAYLPKDMIADWLEAYAWAMEINHWTSTKLVSAAYDEDAGTYTATVLRGDGERRILHPRHLVLANGLVGVPRVPKLPGLEDFEGEVMHTAAYTSGANWRGKTALVIGTGTSAHDVAQDLQAHGCHPTLVQRGATMVVSISPSAKLTYGIFEGIPLEDGDLLASTNTFPMLKKTLQGLTARMVEFDKEMIANLVASGFKWTMGDDGAGHQMMIRRRYGGYYLDAGCAALITQKKIGLLPFERIDRFVAKGALLKDGSVMAVDLIVLATGFASQEAVIAGLLGEEVAGRVGPIWGIGPDGELNNMWKRTPQPGLWIVGGSFAQCRNYSKYVGLQIKAVEEGIIGWLHTGGSERALLASSGHDDA